MFIPRAGAVDIAIECDVAAARDGLELGDNLPAHGTQIGGFRLNGYACTFTFAREIEKVSDDLLNAVHASLHNFSLLLFGAGRGGKVLKPPRSEQNRAERVADVVADDRQNPLLEVSSQRQLLFIVMLQRSLRLASVLDVDAAANESGESAGAVRKGNTTIEDPPVLAIVTAQPVLHFERYTAMKM